MAEDEERHLRRAIVESCRELIRCGLNRGTSGNASVRTAAGLLITPSGLAYDGMEPEQIVAMDLDGRHCGDWLPSSEWRMHRDLYRARPEAGAVVHVHSTHATALACLRRGIPAFHYMVAVAGGANIRCADYATFGTAELSAAMLEAIEGRSACLLANHGQIAFGATLPCAVWRAAEVEALAEQYALACSLGAPVILGEDEMMRVVARFADYGRQPAAAT